MDTHKTIDRPPIDWTGITRWAMGSSSLKIFALILMMVAAGRVDWVWGWLYAGLVIAFDASTGAVVLSRSPGLPAEVSGSGEVKAWDKLLMPLAAGLLPIAAQVIAGLDLRFGWRPEFAAGWQIAGAIATALGYALFAWAVASNPFFAPTVRIQRDRGHTTAMGGPYRFVRHPSYTGLILAAFGIPALLGSVWALIPGGIAAALLVVRTVLEDRTLRAELPGYQEYAGRTRYRLIPGIY